MPFTKEKLLLIRDQFQVLVVRDFKVKYNSTALGFLWTLLLPFAEGFLYYYAFRSVGRFDIQNYFLYLISGMFLWRFFSVGVSSSKKCFRGNAALIKKTNFDRALLVVSRVLTEFVQLLITIPILIGFMLYAGVIPGISFAMLPLILIPIFLFTLGWAFMVATLNMYFRDIEQLVQVFFHIWFFASPIFYDLGNIRGGFEKIILFNPMLYFMMEWRNVFYTPNLSFIGIPLLFAMGMVSFVVGYFIYRVCEPGFAEKI